MDIVADMKVDKVANMVAHMYVVKVAYLVADMEVDMLTNMVA